MGRRRSRVSREPVETTIDDLSHDGRGVAHVDDKAVFIHGALPGERVTFTYRSKRKQFDQGEAVSVLSASPDRVEPPCPHFDVCAGCSLQHLAHEKQLEAKHNVLVQSLARIGKVEPASLFSPVSAGSLHYRRKGRLSVRNVPGKGRVLVGFRERNGRYVADMRECHVLRKELGFSLMELSELLGELEGKGEIPQIEYAGGDDGAVLVFRHLEALSENDHARLVAFDQQSPLTVALQSAGPETITNLQGDPVPDLHYSVDGDAVTFAFGPTDFIQVNAGVNELVIEKSLSLLALNDQSRVLDLFCGLGNLSLPFARRAGQVVGVEGEQSLIDRAVANAESNGIENVEYHVADLREDHGDAPWVASNYDAIVIDPPRSGAKEALALIASMGAPKILYISCNPGTLGRDLGHLVHDHGYRLETSGVFDMFPHTAHVESMALLTRQ